MTKITIDKALLEQVLTLFDKALDTDNVFGRLHNDAMDCICELRAALAEPAVEPYGYLSHDEHTLRLARDVSAMPNWSDYFTIPLYTSPPPSADVPLLTEDEQYEMIDNVTYRRWSLLDLVKNTEKLVWVKAGLK